MSQLKVINAPAGSGKSTEIKQLVSDWSKQRQHEKLLCVTYTNRAADELQSGLTSGNIEVSTIHSFLNRFTKPLFVKPEIVNLYLEVYRDKIEERIRNPKNDERIKASNARYEEELGGPLSFELISNGITQLSYNESNYNSLYRGKLSHDDLLSFVALCARRFEMIYRKVSSKYSRVIIDEYQDTNVEVVDFFVNAVKGTDTSLHLYGDRMQQIYPSDTARFKSVLREFEVEERTVFNFRSSSEIVSTLNRIYNDELLVQKANGKNAGQPPRLHITPRTGELENELNNPGTLVLSIHNSSIFSALGAPTFLRAMQAIPSYAFGSQHPAISILSEKQWDQVQDPLVKLLFGLLKIEEELNAKKYGVVVQMLRRNSKIFGGITLHRHDDKGPLDSGLTDFFNVLRQPGVTIGDVVTRLGDASFMQRIDTDEYLSGEKYLGLLPIPFVEVRSTYAFNQNPLRSTQHGVKGESHQSVVFMAESSPNPRVSMAMLFNVWPKQEINLDSLEDFYLKLGQRMQEAEDQIGAKVSGLKAASYLPLASTVKAEASAIFNEYAQHSLFGVIYGASYEKYLSNPNVTNAKKLFKISDVEGLMAAYKLFYVGCSRARTSLDVIIDSGALEDVEATRVKFMKLGFSVEIHQ